MLSPLRQQRISSIPEHLKVPWTMVDAVFVVAVLVLFQFGVILAVTGLVPFWPDSGHFLALASKGDLLTEIMFYLFYFAPGLGAIGWALRNNHARWGNVGWRGVSVSELAPFMLAGFVAFKLGSALLLAVAAKLAPHFNPNQMQTDVFLNTVGQHPMLAIVTLVVLPPIVEESVFRGFLFPAMAKRMGVIGAAVASSAVFGLAHGQANVALYTFVLGLVLCLMYARLKSIFPGMVLHMANNLLALIALTHK